MRIIKPTTVLAVFLIFMVLSTTTVEAKKFSLSKIQKKLVSATNIIDSINYTIASFFQGLIVPQACNMLLTNFIDPSNPNLATYKTKCIEGGQMEVAKIYAWIATIIIDQHVNLVDASQIM